MKVAQRRDEEDEEDDEEGTRKDRNPFSNLDPPKMTT